MLMQGITYNTTMALVAGSIMIMAVVFASISSKQSTRSLSGWGLAFIALGSFLGISGIYMMLTWPLDQIEGAFCCAVDNITFGEPAALYGILTVIGGIGIIYAQHRADKRNEPIDLVGTLRPILYVAALGGFGLIMFAIAGMHFGMWRPPLEEPIARLMAGSILEPLMVMFLYGFSGVTAILAPFAPDNKIVARIASFIGWGCGIMWFFLSLTVFYSHVGFFPPAA